MNLDNLQLYAVILLAVLIIIALGVIYLHNKKINTLTQQLKKNTFEITALQSVLEGHVSQIFGGGDGGHIHPENLNDISMTTTPKQVSQEEYYGDYNSHLDGQQYTENAYNSQEDNSNQEQVQEDEESVDEDELTDYDSDDEQITIDDVLSNAVEQDSELNNVDDNISLVDENDVNVDDIELSIEDESNIDTVLEDNNSSNNSDVVNVNTESIIEEVSVVVDDDVSSNDSNQKETNTETVVDTVVVDTVEQTVEEETQDTSTNQENTVVEVKSETTDKKEKGPRKKKSPTISAKEYDVGAVILSDNDGHYYTVYENSRGTKRWKKVKDEEKP